MPKCIAHVTLKRPLNKSKAMALTCPMYSWPRILKAAPNVGSNESLGDL